MANSDSYIVAVIVILVVVVIVSVIVIVIAIVIVIGMDLCHMTNIFIQHLVKTHYGQ